MQTVASAQKVANEAHNIEPTFHSLSKTAQIVHAETITTFGVHEEHCKHGRQEVHVPVESRVQTVQLLELRGNRKHLVTCIETSIKVV